MMCFDRHFRPTSQLPRERFVRIDADVRSGRGMDPVELYHCGGHYYVEDGHHRIYVERAYDPVALGWDRAQGAAR